MTSPKEPQMPVFKTIQETDTSQKGAIRSRVTTTTQHFLWKKPKVTTVIDYFEGQRHLWTETVKPDGTRVGYRP